MKCLLAGLLALAMPARALDPMSLQEMPPGDSLDVLFVSQGCFHDNAFELVFQRAATGARTLTAYVTQVERRWNREQRRYDTLRKTALGATEVSAAEAAGLDRLLAFYRLREAGGCTTVDQATVTWKRGDTVRAVESFTDETCRAREVPGVVSLGDVAARWLPEAR